jgi:N6-adenosine-specific RNA methylase IME4
MIHTHFPRPFEDFRQPYEWIVADPPWPYRNVKTGGSMTSGSAAQYSVMTMDEILTLPVPEIAAKNCCCFLWTTTPLLPQGLAVLDRWGFEFKSALYWDKKNYPLGFWFRGRVEPCLIGIRGKVKAFRSSAVNIIQDEPTDEYLGLTQDPARSSDCYGDFVLEEKARGHSVKPEALWNLIEPVIEKQGPAPRIELFSRRERPGWDAFGNQVVPLEEAP